MNYDFQTLPDVINVPKSAYKTIKRCQYCQSVFLNEKNCESCGRSLEYDLIGEPFGPKSFYGLKGRYLENQNKLQHIFPLFENKNSASARSYIRNLTKRFSDLITAFNAKDIVKPNQRKLFYVESIEIIDELLRYNFEPQLLESLLVENDNSLLGQELLLYLNQARLQIAAEPSWQNVILEYRILGVLRVNFILKTIISVVTICIVTVWFKIIISLQFGK